jgi:cytochrome c
VRGPRRNRRALTLTAILLVSLGAVTTAAAAPPALETHIELGRALAADHCSSCHAVGPTGPSPNRRAPPFRVLSGQYVELTLHRKLTEIAETGHYDMPPIPVHSDEVSAIVAYINSLDRPAASASPLPRP